MLFHLYIQTRAEFQKNGVKAIMNKLITFVFPTSNRLDFWRFCFVVIF